VLQTASRNAGLQPLFMLLSFMSESRRMDNTSRKPSSPARGKFLHQSWDPATCV
jgi:hypothetical protein